MSGEQGLGCRSLTLWQQGRDPPPFQVVDDAGVSVSGQAQIINADSHKGASRGMATAENARRRGVLL